MLDFPALDPQISASLKEFEHPVRALTEGHIAGQFTAPLSETGAQPAGTRAMPRATGIIIMSCCKSGFDHLHSPALLPA